MIIGAYLGPEIVAYYQVPFSIVQMTNGFINSVTQFIFPAVSRIHSFGDSDRLKELYTKSTRYVIPFALLAAGGLILLGDTFFSLWMGKEFAERSAFIVPVISFVFFFQSVSAVGFHFYNGLGRSEINMFSSLTGTLFYILASLVLIPRLGLFGAALSFAFTLIPFPVYFYTLNRIISVKIKWFIFAMLKSLAVIAFIIGLKTFITVPMSIGWFIFSGFAFTVLFSFAACLLKLIYIRDFLELPSKLGFA
jgi:O-antigen/teichoic acid export membrane protein